ncbi:hypothetical protein Scep_000177 [Stephania cephalantha]|uniref:Uncharacterized protein n=1 Tax=Stephania cephalantha TaxID=152367 RepID=A0AAP0L629_9MAGN
MASSTSKQQKQYHVRSISLPARSDPSTIRVVAELNKLKAWETTSCPLKADAVLGGLSGLAELYECIHNLLQTPHAQQAQVSIRQENWVDEVLDGSVRLLDLCDNSRNILLQMREAVQALQIALRRRGGEASWESCISDYICCQKKAKKEIEKCLGELKRLEAKLGSSSLPDSEHHLSTAVDALREASRSSICVFRSLLSFISSSSRTRTSKWSLVTKLLHKEQEATKEDEKLENEVKSVDDSLYALCRLNSNYDAKVERVRETQKRLKAMEASVEGLEEGLERLLKSLIQTRVALLNNLCL